MKKYLLTTLVILFSIAGFAQVKGKSPHHKAHKVIKTKAPAQMLPDFTFSKVPDSTVFTKDSLQKDKATILMFFNPDCGHCLVFLKDLLKNYNLLENVQIVMGAPSEHKVLNKFYEDYKIADYPGLTLCRDQNYFLVTHFDLREYPGVYVFNKAGRFVKGFSSTITVEQIVAVLNKK